MSASTAALPPLPLRHCYWVVPGLLLAGEHPGGPTRDKTKDRLKKLLAAGIECFVDLTKPTELPRYDTLLPFYVGYTRKAIKDHGLPGSPSQMIEILEYVGNAMRAGRPVYVHCRAGIGRTGTVMGCLLVERGLSGDGALEELNRLWQQCKRSKSWAYIPETEAQVAYVREWKPGLEGNGFEMSSLAAAVSGVGPMSAAGDTRQGVLSVADVQARAASQLAESGQARAAMQNLTAGKGRSSSAKSGGSYLAGAGLSAAAAQARADAGNVAASAGASSHARTGGGGADNAGPGNAAAGNAAAGRVVAGNPGAGNATAADIARGNAAAGRAAGGNATATDIARRKVGAATPSAPLERGEIAPSIRAQIAEAVAESNQGIHTGAAWPRADDLPARDPAFAGSAAPTADETSGHPPRPSSGGRGSISIEVFDPTQTLPPDQFRGLGRVPPAESVPEVDDLAAARRALSEPPSAGGQASTEQPSARNRASTRKPARRPDPTADSAGPTAQGMDREPASASRTAGAADHATASASRTTGAADHTAVGTGRAVAGADHMAVGAGRAVAGADHMAVGAGRAVEGADHTVVGAGRAVAGADHTAVGAGQPAVGAGHVPVGPRAPAERVVEPAEQADPLFDPATLAAARGLRERFVGTLFGLAIGDAVAAATQFRRPRSFGPVGDMIGGGPFDLPRGAWSDDTAMALCLAESLLERDGFEPRDQVQRYSRWQQDGYLSSTGQCVGITASTSRSLALAKWRRVVFPGSHDPEQLDPEPLSRVASIALFYFASLETTEHQAAESSRTTCQAPAVLDACRRLGRALNAALSGQPRARIVAEAGPMADAESAQTNNTAASALSAAIWALGSTNNFRDAVLRAANVGGNSDVVASVCGQLAGAHYGMSAIPPAWRSGLIQSDLIEDYADKLLAHALVALSQPK